MRVVPLLFVSAALVLSSRVQAEETLPKPEPATAAILDPSRDATPAAWPTAVKANEGAPNVVLVLLDDAGFGAASTFGGPAKTPELDRLAARGLKYNAFHVSALCSPTRAALLSGRTDHQIGFGSVADGATGYPGYNAHWPKSAASLARVLRDNGYSTAAFGKWHNTPYDEISPVGPFDRWPTGLGFEYFYGFLAGYDSQFAPRLYRNTTPVDQTRTEKDGYHLTTDLVEDAVKWLHAHEAVAPQKPFFLYFAPGATHWPHQVQKDWIRKYRGKFDQGWDKLREETFARQKALGVIPANAALTPRPAELPAWDSLNDDQKKLFARQMEVYAAFMEQTDFEIGRLLKSIEKDGFADNTLVLYIAGDNGGSGEGGVDGRDVINADGTVPPAAARLQRADEFGEEIFDNHYAAAWAWASSTPFQWTKQVASHLGGTRDPLIVSWPAKIKTHGELRTQFQHVTDIAPTIYELAGITPPDKVDGFAQTPLEGKSFAASFFDAAAPSSHKQQVFETSGNRAIYQGGWWAGARHAAPWSARRGELAIGQNPWELYNLDQDFSQARDLAKDRPDKLRELTALFDSEARRTQIYPLLPARKEPPSPADGRTVFDYRPGADHIPQRIGPKFNRRAHSIVADVTLPEAPEGVIFADGGDYGGFSLYVKDGKLVYLATAWGNVTGKIVSREKLSRGAARIGVEFIPDATNPPPVLTSFEPRVVYAGKVVLSVDGAEAAQGRIENLQFSYNETLDVGLDSGAPVSPDYASPFPFNGQIDKVRVELR
ncbi:arylsulfatase [Methylocystis heyeri]|uniref:Sulfatase-like hydrolase/transferase n=1 Tax=Methylocystis heyeri TaxID=391905 RepID=A0A6B8KHG0_9HYPH|nr:arylsulfatase [Methylocystis heyeri]QGM46415.1 sulfatase-like hydrolase/transferase [Methylocystis heyeri]